MNPQSKIQNPKSKIEGLFRPLVLWAGAVSLLLSAGIRAGAQAIAQSNKPALSGVLEDYFWAYQSENRVEADQHCRYLHLDGALNSAVGVTVGQLVYSGKSMLDENFISLNQGDRSWRVGRFRPAFGIYSWDDNYYIPLLRAPIVPNYRMDTGADVSGRSKYFQYQVGIVDDASTHNQLLPKHPDHLVMRLQTYTHNLILGIDSLVNTHDSGSDETRLFGLDWRWTTTQLQVRGELLGGRERGADLAAYYVDLYYHPFKLYKTSFGVRAEASNSKAGLAQLYTLGVRQVINPFLTLQIAHAWGNGIAPAKLDRGWAVQAITFVHFSAH